MGEVLKFQTKQERAKDELIGVIAQLRTTKLEDGSIWYKIGTQASLDKEIIWDEWRKVGEIT